eukprot:snap_masked-scaffold_52-processed-gene-1.79-mRNA-1 protein AED:1.00 eAED:1.00 QI:0/0/0/0/1/1/2/0/68
MINKNGYIYTFISDISRFIVNRFLFCVQYGLVRMNFLSHRNLLTALIWFGRSILCKNYSKKKKAFKHK